MPELDRLAIELAPHERQVRYRRVCVCVCMVARASRVHRTNCVQILSPSHTPCYEPTPAQRAASDAIMASLRKFRDGMLQRVLGGNVTPLNVCVLALARARSVISGLGAAEDPARPRSVCDACP